jgi:hypothetical protein
MTATRRMWAGFILFGVAFFVFDSGMTRDGSWPHWLVYGSGALSLLSFLYAMYVFYFDVTRGDKHLQRTGIKGTAVVLSAKQTRTQAQTGQLDFNAPYIWKYELQVSIPGKEPYKAGCGVALANLREGSTVEVAVSRYNKRSVAIVRSPQTTRADRRADRNSAVVFTYGQTAPGGQPMQSDDRLAQLLAMSDGARRIPAPGQPVPGPSAPGESASQSGGEQARLDALTKLADLHRQGVLSDAEFAAEKSRILGS